MENLIPAAGEDADVFQRVWQRVMGGRDAVPAPPVPIDTMPPELQGDLPCGCKEAVLFEAPSAQTDAEAEEAAKVKTNETVSTQYIPDPVLPTPEQSMRSPAPSAASGTGEPTPLPLEPGIQLQEVPKQACACQEQPVPDPKPGTETVPLAPGKTPCRGSDMPRLWEQPQEVPDCTNRLRRQVMGALEGWQFYRMLARRARSCDARTLNALAGEEHRCARKLSAAYFLATGMRYWPLDLLTAPALPSYWGALRNRYQAEQKLEMDYRISADDWPDPDMQSLYQELTEGCQGRCRQLRALLEADHTV